MTHADTAQSQATDPAVRETAARVADAHRQMLDQMGRVIIGQHEVVDLLLLGLLCRGHCILEGVPGLAKTLIISSLSKLLGLKFGRVQFTPDLMPSDITGTEILEEDHTATGGGRRYMRFVKGPLFANMLLADEINRTPPKTQAALLQAMQEYQVTVAGEHYDLDQPFFVLGTQNPIESEGTYPLPEAAMDRFMFKIQVSYPSQDEEIQIALTTTSQQPEQLAPVAQSAGHSGDAGDHAAGAGGAAGGVVWGALVRATRPQEEGNPDFVQHYLAWGAGPRACQALLLGAKARALLDGRPQASIDDIRAIAKPVLRHRLVANFTAESENVTTDDVIDELIGHVPEAE